MQNKLFTILRCTWLPPTRNALELWKPWATSADTVLYSCCCYFSFGKTRYNRIERRELSVVLVSSLNIRHDWRKTTRANVFFLESVVSHRAAVHTVRGTIATRVTAVLWVRNPVILTLRFFRLFNIHSDVIVLRNLAVKAMLWTFDYGSANNTCTIRLMIVNPKSEPEMPKRSHLCRRIRSNTESHCVFFFFFLLRVLRDFSLMTGL